MGLSGREDDNSTAAFYALTAVDAAVSAVVLSAWFSVAAMLLGNLLPLLWNE